MSSELESPKDLQVAKDLLLQLQAEAQADRARLSQADPSKLLELAKKKFVSSATSQDVSLGDGQGTYLRDSLRGRFMAYFQRPHEAEKSGERICKIFALAIYSIFNKSGDVKAIKSNLRGLKKKSFLLPFYQECLEACLLKGSLNLLEHLKTLKETPELDDLHRCKAEPAAKETDSKIFLLKRPQQETSLISLSTFKDLFSDHEERVFRKRLVHLFSFILFSKEAYKMAIPSFHATCKLLHEAQVEDTKKLPI